MNLLDLEEATQGTNLTENSEYSGSRASTISDTIIGPLEGGMKVGRHKFYQKISEYLCVVLVRLVISSLVVLGD